MYLHPRLLALTEGVRLRILAAALVGLLAMAAGVARLAVAAVVIVKVIHEGAAFSTLTWALVAIAVLIVVRSVLQYLQEVISHHTASIVKVQLRKSLYEHSLALGPGYFDQSRTGEVMLSLADGVERLEAFFGKYLPQLIVAAVAPILIFIFMAIIDLRIGFIFLVKLHQLSQGTENFHAQHQNYQQRAKLQATVADPNRPVGQRHSRSRRNAQHRNGAGYRVCRQNSHGGAVQASCPVGQQLAPDPALPEGLQRTQALDRIQEVGA